MATTDIIAWGFWIPLVVIGALYALYRFWWVQDAGRRLTSDRIRLRIPLLGGILRRTAIAEFTRTFALLLRSGLSMLVTLDLCRSAASNSALAMTIQDMRESVERGEGLERPLRVAERRHVMPGVVVDMLVTGEESGAVDNVADQIADIYEEEVEIAVDALRETIPTIVTLFMGVIVALIAFALFQPLADMINKMAAGGI